MINRKYISPQIILVLLCGFVLGIFAMWLFSPADSETHNHAAVESGAAAVETTWTCSMHPQIRQPKPGKCPICFMDLIPVTNTDGDDNPRQLSMSETARKLAQIQTAPVERRFAEHELRLIGKVEYDETRVKSITARIPGRLDRLYVDYTGTPIRKGEHLVDIYSPELITDQEALLQTLRAARNASGSDAVAQNRQSILRNARERLRLLGLSDEQIREIEERGATTEHVVINAPIDGIVIEKSALEGNYVDVGDPIYKIADLTQVWVMMDAYESDLSWVHYGQEVEFTTIAYPGETFHGRIAYIAPFLNPETRTVKVRVNVENQQGKLRPGMFVDSLVRSKVTDAGRVFAPELAGKWICPMHPEIIKDTEGVCDICEMPLVPSESLGFAATDAVEEDAPLLVPATAVLSTGKRAVVYVEVPNTERPTYEGRVIEPGPRVGDYYMVQSGLHEGEQVVTNGNFKIDSALQIQARPSMMMRPADEAGHDHAQEGAEEAPAAPAIQIPEEALPMLLPHYRQISLNLAGDDLEAAKTAAQEYEKEAVSQDLSALATLAQDVQKSETIENARFAFSIISELTINAVNKHGAPQDTLYLAYCPMAFNNKGGRWLQWDQTIHNPYFGAMMLKCGEIQEEYPVGQTVDQSTEQATDQAGELAPQAEHQH